ncbi:MAG: acetyl-CoA carboxylase biotin carboxyl carrier protein [Candidatus Porifericomitaceae bacterium WSBS_2022_MAG_OTU9]
MDVRKVKKLIEMLEQSDVAEIEVREGEECVRISKHPQVAAMPQALPIQQVEVSTQASAAAQPEQDSNVEDTDHVVKSPMVGIFYASSSPEGEHYVTAGQSVAKGDVLCIIEAMKVMNHIEAPIAGVVKAVHVGNGEPVEFGEPLFTID